MRPSINWFFRSAAASFGDRCIAVVLSESGSDGSLGARCVSFANGSIIVQDPRDCDYPGMRFATIETGISHELHSMDSIGAAIAAALMRIEDTSSASLWDDPFSDTPATGRLVGIANGCRLR